MGKSSDHKGAAPRDGRRNNKPPEHDKIRPREVRNPNGRAGKPNNVHLTKIDKMFWQEAGRTVSHDAEGPVDAMRRMIQEEFFDALRKSDPAARVRLIAQLREIADRKEQSERAQREELEHFMERKIALTDEFHTARKLCRPPPDVIPHPDHVKVSPTDLSINGPMDAESRKIWEQLKATIKITACQHRITRDEYRRNQSESVLRDLRSVEKHRRRLIRAVPPGWSWREEIYCRDSEQELICEVVSKLERIGYVPSETKD